MAVLALWQEGGVDIAAAIQGQQRWRDLAAEVIAVFSEQGDHRTGTPVDTASAEWLRSRVESAGHSAHLEAFPLDRVDIVDARVIVEGAAIPALPLFDGGFTGPDGVTGPVGTSHADIALVETGPISTGVAGSSPGLDTVRSDGVAAIIAVTGRGDEIAPRNANSFVAPWGPPVVQVAPSALPALAQAREAGVDVTVVADARREPGEAFNVVAGVPGTQEGLKPLVVMTPRSGWGACASERGGGLVCWLAALQSLAGRPPARTVHFVATSGHELGHIGLEDYIERRLELPAEAHLWVHLGANIGATSPRRLAVRASDAALATHTAGRLQQALPEGAEVIANPPGPIHGEAANVAGHGGRFLSVVGANDAFHLPGDRWPDTVDVDVVAAVAAAVVDIVHERAGA